MTAEAKAATETPLRIPYGNKDLALKLGVRYRQVDGMPRRASTLPHSTNAAGYDQNWSCSATGAGLACQQPDPPVAAGVPAIAAARHTDVRRGTRYPAPHYLAMDSKFFR